MIGSPGRLAIEAALWLLSLCGAAVGVRGWRSVSAKSPHPVKIRILPVRGLLADSAFLDTTRVAAERIAAHDPFRISHSPSTVAYTPGVGQTSQAYQAPPSSPKPRLVIRGIYGRGGDWHAILSGVPGKAEGIIVQAGDSAAGLHVRRITHDTVIVRGLDTTWTLIVRSEWQP